MKTIHYKGYRITKSRVSTHYWVEQNLGAGDNDWVKIGKADTIKAAKELVNFDLQPVITKKDLELL